MALFFISLWTLKGREERRSEPFTIFFLTYVFFICVGGKEFED